MGIIIRRALAGVAFALFTFVSAILVVLVLTGEVGRPILWEIKGGYRGWIIVGYENPTCARLDRRGIYLVISVPYSGRACTSSPMPKGWRYERYVYVGEHQQQRALRSVGWNRDPEIWPISTDPKKKLEYLFVGSKKELDEGWRSRPD